MEFICGPEWDKRIINLKPKKNIGILLSSGLDSTTILGLMLLHFDSNVMFFNVQTSQDPHKPKIEKLLELIGRDPNELIVVGESRYHWPMKSHYPRLCRGFQEIRETYPILDELYCGNILTPHPQFFPRWDVNQNGIAKRPWLTNDAFLKNPFEHLEKYHVLDLGRRNGLNYLYKHTISCNIDADDPCHECMGCLELKWAYDQLDRESGVTLDEMTDHAVMNYGAIGW